MHKYPQILRPSIIFYNFVTLKFCLSLCECTKEKQWEKDKIAMLENIEILEDRIEMTKKGKKIINIIIKVKYLTLMTM